MVALVARSLGIVSNHRELQFQNRDDLSHVLVPKLDTIIILYTHLNQTPVSCFYLHLAEFERFGIPAAHAIDGHVFLPTFVAYTSGSSSEHRSNRLAKPVGWPNQISDQAMLLVKISILGCVGESMGFGHIWAGAE